MGVVSQSDQQQLQSSTTLELVTKLVNLQQKRMPEKKKRRLTTVCTICNGPSASHLHYGAIACYSCRAFFRRGIGKSYCCVEGTGDCTIDWTNRRSCQWCRFDKCLRVGMNPDLVDASIRKNSLRKKSSLPDQTVLIDNLQPIENSEVFSNVFKDMNYQQDVHSLSFSSPDHSTFLGDLGTEKVYLLTENENIYSLPDWLPGSSSVYPTSEQSEETNANYDIVNYYSDYQAGLDNYMDDFHNVPDNTYQLSLVEVTEEESIFHNQNTSSVIVKTNPPISLLDEKNIHINPGHFSQENLLPIEFSNSVLLKTPL